LDAPITPNLRRLKERKRMLTPGGTSRTKDLKRLDLGEIKRNI